MSDKPKIVLVCGGRDFGDKDFVFNMLEYYEEIRGPFSMLIHGGAAGADTMAKEWAFYHHLPAREFRAAWKKYGKRAGPLRNQRMLDEGKPDLVIAFPGGSGTRDVINRAEASGIDLIEVGRTPT